MADPVTLTAISLGATAAGGGISALSSIMGGKAKSASYKYQAGLAAINSQIAKQNADYERNVGEVEAQQSGLRTKAEIGATRAIEGASGLDVNSGSAARVQSSEREIGWNNQQIIRANSARRAYGYEVEAMNETAQGQLYKRAASQAKTAGILGAGATLLSTAGSVAGKWSQASTAGVFGKGDSEEDDGLPA